MPLQLLAVIVLGLMCGSEMNVAVFGHPTLNKQALEVHIPVRASFAKLFGRIMPFWMAVSTLLNLLLLLPFEHSNRLVWRIDAIALTIQVAAVVFSLIGPVPINNRIARWAPDSLPSDWHVQEHRWDVYHWLRTSGLIAAFLLLTFGLAPPKAWNSHTHLPEIELTRCVLKRRSSDLPCNEKVPAPKTGLIFSDWPVEIKPSCASTL